MAQRRGLSALDAMTIAPSCWNGGKLCFTFAVIAATCEISGRSLVRGGVDDSWIVGALNAFVRVLRPRLKQWYQDYQRSRGS